MSPDHQTTHQLPAFPELSTTGRDALRDYQRLLVEVLPMKAVHRRRLPDSIQDLSTFLTTERKEMIGRDYLHEPQILGAYLWYFLPWNILRLARLLGGLDLAPILDRQEATVIVDLGAGPLTLVQALALARPDLLSRELHFYCLDSTPRPMREGRKLYFGLLDLLGVKANWRTHLVHTPWRTGLRDLPRAHILTATNFMNELPWHRRDPLIEQMNVFFETVAEHVRGDGQCLFVEPGNRLGGKLVSMIRQNAVDAGWNVLSPCTHGQPCPMLGSQRETSWCHFSLSTSGCPDWLAAVSRDAGLPKRDVSLSYAHLSAPRGLRPPHSGERGRIISAEFSLPPVRGVPQTGRYACSARGKVLLVSSQGEPGTRSGDVVSLELSQSLPRDTRSQALITRLHPVTVHRSRGEAAQTGTRRKAVRGPSGGPAKAETEISK